MLLVRKGGADRLEPGLLLLVAASQKVGFTVPQKKRTSISLMYGRFILYMQRV